MRNGVELLLLLLLVVVAESHAAHVDHAVWAKSEALSIDLAHSLLIGRIAAMNAEVLVADWGKIEHIEAEMV